MSGAPEHHYDNTVLKLHEESHEEWLGRARLAAIQIAKDRGTCTADDVWDVCPPPIGKDPRVLGAVFKPPAVWEKVGYVQSTRRINHGRAVMRWKLRRQEAAE